MNKRNNDEKEIRKLLETVLETVIRSGQIRETMHRLIEKGIITENDYIDLILPVSQIIHGVLPSKDKASDERREKTQGRRETDSIFQKIDGQKLSEYEIKFAEFCAEKFDEENWLKRNKITSKGN